MATVVDQNGLRGGEPEVTSGGMRQSAARLDPDSVFRLHLTIIAFLAAMHVTLLLASILTGHDHLLGLNPLFNLNIEGNVPTFFVGMALLAAALAAALVAWQAQIAAPENVRGWWIIAACLVFLAFDDVAQVHERIGGIFRSLSGNGDSLSSPWIILYAPLVVVVGAICIPLWWRLPQPTKVGLALSGALYVGAELGLEVVQAALVQQFGDPGLAGQSMAYKVLVSIEEVTGMVAVALLLRTLLTHFFSQGGALVIDLVEVDRSADLRGGHG